MSKDRRTWCLGVYERNGRYFWRVEDGRSVVVARCRVGGYKTKEECEKNLKGVATFIQSVR